MLGWIWHCTVLENLVLRLGQEIFRISNQTNANSREEAYLGKVGSRYYCTYVPRSSQNVYVDSIYLVHLGLFLNFN